MRVEAYEWYLVEGQGFMQLQRPLPGVISGQFDWTTGRQIRGGGSITVTTEGLQAIASRPNDQVRCWARVETDDGIDRWPVATFVPAVRTVGWEDAGSTTTIDLYEKTLMLDEDRIPESYSIGTGVNVVAMVRMQLQALGRNGRSLIEDSDEVTASRMTWPAGTSRMRIVNDLLGSINYWGISTDGRGRFVSRPHQSANRRPAQQVFTDGRLSSIYTPDVNIGLDLFGVPNRLICISTTDGEEEAMVAVSEDHDLTRPTSYVNRGRWVTRVDEMVEASSESVLQSIADRRLAEAVNTATEVTLHHAVVPLQINDVVRFVHSPSETSIRGTVRSMSIRCEPGELMETRIREVG